MKQNTKWILVLVIIILGIILVGTWYLMKPSSSTSSNPLYPLSTYTMPSGKSCLAPSNSLVTGYEQLCQDFACNQVSSQGICAVTVSDAIIGSNQTIINGQMTTDGSFRITKLGFCYGQPLSVPLSASCGNDLLPVVFSGVRIQNNFLDCKVFQIGPLIPYGQPWGIGGSQYIMRTYWLCA